MPNPAIRGTLKLRRALPDGSRKYLKNLSWGRYRAYVRALVHKGIDPEESPRQFRPGSRRDIS